MTNATHPHRTVDHSVISVNQLCTISLLALAFVLDLPLLAAFTGLVMLTTVFMPALGLFTRLYLHVLRPAGLIQPRVHLDNPEPHRFAQFVGATFVLAGFGALAASVPVLGWTLIGIVIALANLNLWAGWCAGCTMYYWLHHLGVPGFKYAPVDSAH